MPKNIIVYFVALFLIIGSIFFLSSYFLDLQSQDTVKKNSKLIFEAKNISINLNFKESNLLLKLSSSMINSKKSEKNLYVFKPEISIKGEDKFNFPDNFHAISIKKVNELVKNIKLVQKSLGNGFKLNLGNKLREN